MGYLAADLAMSACPGCGVILPGPSEAWNPRSTASSACYALYGEALGYEYEHVAELGRWHQLLVDTYAAQHAGERTAPITTAFALIGLYLTLEHGHSGVEVRDAHQLLASRHRDWPQFWTPPALAPMTVQDLLLTEGPNEYVEVLFRWARAVWWVWRDEEARVAGLVNERLPGLGAVVVRAVRPTSPSVARPASSSKLDAPDALTEKPSRCAARITSCCARVGM